MTTKEEFIAGLNHDLALELGATIQYGQHGFLIFGPYRDPVKAVLNRLAMDEMRHIDLLGDKIVSLGGHPTTQPAPVYEADSLEGMLRLDLEAENGAIGHYRERIRQAEELGDTGTRIMLENILMDEVRHAEDLDKVLRGLA